MYRTNAQSRLLEEAFLRAGMPYRLVGAQRFYGRREVKDMIAYLRLVQNPADEVSLGRVINVPPRGIGDKTMVALQPGRAAGRTSAPARCCSIWAEAAPIHALPSPSPGAAASRCWPILAACWPTGWKMAQPCPCRPCSTAF